MPRITNAQLLARIATLEAQLASTPAPVAPSEASAHWKSRDLRCTLKACPNVDGFRTQKGLDWHIANVKHGK